MKSNQKEFLKIISAYQEIIHKVNLIYFRSDADKQDNFQEVVYQLWRSFLGLKDKNKPASWIYAVAINTSISKIRKDSKLVFTNDIPEIPYTSTTDNIEQDINYQRLLDALQKLNETDRSIMLLYMEDYNYDDIAEIIGISTSNVGVKIYRLKEQLRKLLKD
ncbi:sigma-70 family RNA polymerase sigma factor [Dysgonomonas sp. Marseille-P4677]|uniref:RNA polymerase sigma factor n=1 Tax=Dysgonomonas sp. Marseille-P4677 TaxID=2364790 RepID=UPI0019147130|nr:sigma-70 family RNA polymerase sigma factor [Dysgonomonas sp. Marseille-P4677]MBK5721179.1 sigma-70 family RNA polymerase sigma factor [Dysgonomonas sp. Marseille-P4677]